MKLAAAAAVIATLLAAGCGGGNATEARETPRTTPAATTPERVSIAPELRALEREFDARLGVSALDTGDGRQVAFRANERFPYASTFKALAAGAILHRYGLDGLGERVPIESLTNAYSPITEQRLGTSMTLRALSSAAVRHSDNTAANLLLDRLGGPKGLDAFLERELGDDVTQVERREPELNEWELGETRDTSTPRALASDLRALVLGDALDPPERRQLTAWLRTNTTGDALIRAGVPRGWRVGDKTGTGATYGARNDIAVLWPPDRDPIVLAIMSRRDTREAEHDDALLARAAEAVTTALD